MERIIRVVEILRENGIRVQDYEGKQDQKDFVTGRIYVINDIPFFLMDNVADDVLNCQEKMSTFVAQLKQLKKL